MIKSNDPFLFADMA
uniref:Uncharacterized protein n=1 Tax=Arundo donax TaxID=35708 RepID=A0A0A9AA57_ARUDO